MLMCFSTCSEATDDFTQKGPTKLYHYFQTKGACLMNENLPLKEEMENLLTLYKNNFKPLPLPSEMVPNPWIIMVWNKRACGFILIHCQVSPQRLSRPTWI